MALAVAANAAEGQQQWHLLLDMGGHACASARHVPTSGLSFAAAAVHGCTIPQNLLQCGCRKGPGRVAVACAQWGIWQCSSKMSLLYLALQLRQAALCVCAQRLVWFMMLGCSSLEAVAVHIDVVQQAVWCWSHAAPAACWNCTWCCTAAFLPNFEGNH